LILKPSLYSPDLVRETRKILGASRPVFALFLGVKLKAVQDWEHGVRPPGSMARRFMDAIRDDPKRWRERFLGAFVVVDPGACE
jgi:DNA-binding transcriptional regulator YiaG